MPRENDLSSFSLDYACNQQYAQNIGHTHQWQTPYLPLKIKKVSQKATFL